MQHIRILVVLLLLNHSCFAQNSSGIKHVVVIGIDGLSVNGFKKAKTPCMDSLMKQGAYSYSAQSILPTSSTPNWNAMICGVGPEATGAIDNSWSAAETDFAFTGLDAQRRFPTIFAILRQQRPQAEIGSIYDWTGFAEMLNKDELNLAEYCQSQAEVAQKSADYIRQKSPDFLFIHLDDVDHIGHAIGHLSAEYVKTVEKTDKHVKQIVDAISQNKEMAESTMIMVVSDHGGFTNTHGGMMYEELNTPIIFAGKGIKKNYEIQEQIYKYDVAANVCFALGLQQPQLWIGRPNKSAFAGFDEPANLWKGRKVLPPPMFITKTIINPYGGLFIDTPAVVNIQMPIDQKGEIRYTLDGSRPDKQSQLYNAPFLLNKSAVVTAAVFNESERSTFARGEYRVAKTGGNRGLSYTLYHLDKESNGLPDFDKMKPVGTGAWYDLGVVLPENEIKETPIAKRLTQFKTGMGIRFSGWIKIDKDGYYNFSIWCTGAAKLFLNGELVVNNNNNGSQHRGNGGMVYLKKGYSAIKLDMFYNRGSDRILLSTRFHLGDEPNRIVPGNILFKQKPSK